MSLLSRFLRKDPSPQTALPESEGKAAPKPGAADRALAAEAEEKALQSALESRDMPALARLVTTGTSTKVRQAAAQGIEDPDLLRQLLREVRGGNDKNVYKVLSAKRDALLEQTRKAEQLQADLRAAAADLERHSHYPYDPLYSLRLDQYERRWNELAAQADADLQDKARHWIEQARATVAEHARQLAAEEAAQQAAAEAAAAAERQREAQAQAAAEQARLIEEQERALHEKHQAEQQALRDIGDLIRKARGALGDGSSARAAGLRRTLEEKLAGAPPLPANLASQIQQLDRQLSELKDWKSFSVAPKRAELIEAMEALIGAELEPQALADKIKHLQDEWRTLSKGAGENAEAEWQRFHDAAQKAYEPCKAFFAAQAAVREENFKRREALLAELSAFEAGQDWAQADWKAVIKTLRDTKQAWRDCSDVDWRTAKPQQKRFEAVAASLQARIDAEHARNVKQKEALIERAQKLLALDDVRQAMDGVKTLQQQWQSIGPVPREADQRLWGTFRQHCDAVFQKRRQESAAHAAGLEQNKAQANALCEQIEAIAALESAELQARAAGLTELRKAFEALGEFPRADSRELHKRLERALERCKKALARQQARDAEHSWNHLFEAANHARAYRLAVARKLDAGQITALKEAAETYIASVPRWPKGGLDALKKGLAAEGSTDLAANAAALRMLCIRAEILVDLPTPAEDQSLRRDYQLQRLVQKMGQGASTDEPKLDGLTMQWVQVGPVEDADYEPLMERFRRCRERGG
jgi:hypothetical protein